MDNSTTENKVSPVMTGIRFGLIAVLVNIIYFIVLQMTGNGTNQALASVGYLFLVIILVLAYKNYKANNNGFMTIGEGLGIGMVVSLILGLLSSIFSVVYFNFIDPSAMSQMKDIQMQKMEEQGMSEAQIQQASEMMEKFMSPGMMIGIATLMFLIVGFILSLIVSAIMKNNPEIELN